MKLHYRPEIDGLRAVAVLPVILFHAGFQTFGGGFVGVDVFFVISGYLITSLIVKDLEAGHFSFLDFYERRARRILPALFLVLTCSIPFAWQWMMPAVLRTFSNTLVSVVLFFSNIRLWQQSGYFDTAAHLKPLLHTWSLAVEEQYYIVFPFLMVLLWRLGRRNVIWSIGLMAAASFALSEYMSRSAPEANFFLLPTRAWELLAGALCAFAVLRPALLRDNLLSAAGLGAIGLAVFAYDETTPFPSAYALLPVLGTCALLLFAREGTAVRSLLAAPPLVAVGLVSYSAYLWHQPLFAFARIRYGAAPPWPFMLLLCGAALALAYVTWRFLEVPARRKGSWPLPSRRSAAAVFALTGGLLVAAGLMMHSKGGTMRALWNFTHPAFAGTSALLETALTKKNFGVRGEDEQQFSECRFNVSSVTDSWIRQIDDCRRRHGPGVLVLGDSHAIDLFGMLASRFDTPFLVGLTSGGCRPNTRKPDCQYDDLLAMLAHDQPFGLIVYEQAGFYLMRDASGKPGSRDMFENLALSEPVAGITPDLSTIDVTYAYLKKLAAFAKVMWFGPRMEPHVPETFLLRNGCSKPFQLRPNQEATFAALDARLKALVSSEEVITYVSQIDLLQLAWPQDLIDCTAVYFSDSDHYSAAGEQRFGKRLPGDFLQR